MYNNLPVIILAGDGGSGKDTVAEILSNKSGIPYTHSTSYAAAGKMWEEIKRGEHHPVTNPFHYTNAEEWYAARSRHRRFWADWIDNYNKTSQSKCRLYTECVEQGNHILTGIRKAHELAAFISTGIPDITIWIDKPGTPRDPTQEYGSEKCDLIFPNVGDFLSIQIRVVSLVKLLQAYKRM